MNEAVSQQAPASSPGADDPSGGIAAGSGGVSSAAYVDSPVPSEQKSVVQATVDTVKSYLPSYLGGLSLGGADKSTEEGEGAGATKDADGEEDKGTVAAATGGAAAGVAAAGTAVAAKVGLGGDSSTGTDSAEEKKDTEMADSSQKDESTTNEQSAGGEGTESKSGGTGKKENREAIPTAGGERLGDKHWGDSKVVPDVPKAQPEGTQVSSEEGQPDSKSFVSV